VWIHIDINRLAGPIPIYVALLFSSSGIALLQRMKATLMGTFILFWCQSIYAICIVYDQLYSIQGSFIEQGVNMAEIMEYNRDGMGFLLSSLYIILANELLLLSCLWLTMVYLLKRSSDTPFPLSLL
jgi:hypothetical protein